MDENTGSTSHPQSSKSTNWKRKQLKKTKTLPIIKQTKTSMIRLVNANPLLLLHDKSKEEKSKLAGIQVPKSFDFQKTEEFIKATYGLFKRMMPMKSTSLTNLKDKPIVITPTDTLFKKTKPNINKNEQKDGKKIKSSKEIVKYYKSNNNNTDNSKNRRNLKEYVNNKQIQKEAKKPFRKEHKNTIIKKSKPQEKCIPSDKFDTKFLSVTVRNDPSSSNSLNMSPIEKDALYLKVNLKAHDRVNNVFFSTPIPPKRQ